MSRKTTPSRVAKAQPLWRPGAQRIAQARLTGFARKAIGRWQLDINTWPDFLRWSIDSPEQFWASVWDDCGVIAWQRGEQVVIDREKMPGARWFPQARLNFAENLLRVHGANDGAKDALVFWGEDKLQRRVSRDQLRQQVSCLAQALRAAGVGPGDRVAGYLPNMPEAIMAMLAAASIGAMWSSCSPDFGVQGVVDRFGQIEPKVLFAVDGYWYNGKFIDCLPKLREIVMRLPALRLTVIVPYAGLDAPAVDASAAVASTAIANAAALAGSSALSLQQFLAPYAPQPLVFAQLPFDHPLYILYSSGTTGVPKCIVHGAGGCLVKHLVEQQLHADLKPDDRLFYFTTLGWMMWNWLVSGLASGATLLLYDGSPFLREGRILWDYADAERMTHFGTSAKFIDACAKAGLQPVRTHRLDTVHTILSTGSPLLPESFDYVYQSVKKDVLLGSVSGGTDICGCFVLSNPILPVWRGEIQSLGLGMKIEVWDEQGRPQPDGKGELVCSASFPSMPVAFWNDPGDAKYRAAYFEHFPGVWRHGDWCELTPHGGMVVYGRSDATLNPGGVRIGTAEIYRQVEQLDEVVESLVIGQNWPPGQLSDVRIVLFVRLRDGLTLDAALVQRICQQVRRNTTPRHVPAKVLQVADIPRTKSNKIVELAVRNIVHGEPVRNVEALANPEALEHFRQRPELAD
jgi:acetoacetyl-CoA synthetase